MTEPIRFAVCIRNAGNEASLELRKLYQVITDPGAEKDGMLRVVDESGEDYLFPTTNFVLAPLQASVEEAVQQASRRKFEAVLSKVPDIEPDEADRILP
jgi:hypothetical protein